MIDRFRFTRHPSAKCEARASFSKRHASTTRVPDWDEDISELGGMSVFALSPPR